MLACLLHNISLPFLQWQHVTNIDEILTILVEKLTVKLALEDQSEPYCIDFHDQTELNSFVTCLAGYYR